MNLKFTARSERDLIAIGKRIAADNPVRANSFVDEIVASCRKIANYPESYPHVRDDETLRFKVHRRYRIPYEIRADHVLIVSVRQCSSQMIETRRAGTTPFPVD